MRVAFAALLIGALGQLASSAEASGGWRAEASTICRAANQALAKEQPSIKAAANPTTGANRLPNIEPSFVDPKLVPELRVLVATVGAEYRQLHGLTPPAALATRYAEVLSLEKDDLDTYSAYLYDAKENKLPLFNFVFALAGQGLKTGVRESDLWKQLAIPVCDYNSDKNFPTPAPIPSTTFTIDFNTATAPAAATAAQETVVKQKLDANPHVTGFKFVSKQQALATMKKKEPALVKALPFNPFPDTITVTVTNGRYTPAIAAEIRRLPGVDKVLVSYS